MRRFAVFALLGLAGCDTAPVRLPVSVATAPTRVPWADCVVEGRGPVDFATVDPVLGYSAEDVAAAVAGEHVVSLGWLASPLLTYGPEHGSGTLHITITPSQRAEYVTRRPGAPGGPLAGDCPPSFQIDASIGLRTEGGALSDTFAVTLDTTSAETALVVFSADAAALTGTFTAALSASTGLTLEQPLTVNFQLLAAAQGVGGEIWIEPRTTSGAAVAQGIASFPAQDYCGLEAVGVRAEQLAGGVSMNSSIAAFQAQNPLSVRYDDGASTELVVALVPLAARVCKPIWGTLSFLASATVTSSDGRVKGTFPVGITTEGTVKQGLVRTTMQGGMFVQPDGVIPRDLVARHGIRDAIPLDDYAGAHVEFIDYIGEQRGGFFSLDGLRRVDPDLNGGNNTMRTRLWGMRWGALPPGYE